MRFFCITGHHAPCAMNWNLMNTTNSVPSWENPWILTAANELIIILTIFFMSLKLRNCNLRHIIVCSLHFYSQSLVSSVTRPRFLKIWVFSCFHFLYGHPFLVIPSNELCGIPQFFVWSPFLGGTFYSIVWYSTIFYKCGHPSWWYKKYLKPKEGIYGSE